MSYPLTQICPFCRTALAPQGPRSRACRQCGAAHHRECLVLHGGCAIYGCGARLAEEDCVDEWTIDPRDPVPIGEQIGHRILFAIAGGVYAPGDKLPTVRELARRLRVNPNTVSKAYRDLEREGVLVSRRGTGVFVHEDALDAAVERRQAQVLTRFERAVGEAIDAGLDPSEILDVVTEALRRATRARGRALELPASPPRWAGGRIGTKAKAAHTGDGGRASGKGEQE